MRRLRNFRVLFWFCVLIPVSCGAAGIVSNLAVEGEAAWVDPDRDLWRFEGGVIRGETVKLDAAKTDPAGSAFLLSTTTFDGDIAVSLDITFETGRYIGVYVDWDPSTQTGIWMATGHPLAEDPAERTEKVEMAYIKTVEKGDWTVRAKGELLIEPGQLLRLRFTRAGEDYSVWHEDRLVATYRKPGGYPSGRLQLRLVNAQAEIHRLEVSGVR